ncbi:MAG TPA: DsbC family protein [Gammaproteobacteria bacterium]|jgi:thiol:disulfide interchange protein DsbC
MRHLILMFLLLGCAYPALADDVSARLAKQLRVDPKEVTATGIAGLYRVTLGPQILYLTADGKYALRGDLIELSSGRDLSAEDRAAARMAYLNGLGEKDMIVFPAVHPRHVLTVLTDIDCAYCRQLAGDMPRLLASGIELRYLAYPRSGVDSPSWAKAVAVWCAKDRQAAYRSAMQGKAVAAASGCDQSAVLTGYDFATKLGLEGTPILITEGGRIIDGYLPPEDLVKLLDDPAALAAQGG